MAPIEFEISKIHGKIVASTVIPERVGEYPIDGSTLDIPGVIYGRKNGQTSIKAVKAGVGPPYSDGRIQRYPFNGKPSDTVPPEAENTLGGGMYKGRMRIVPENNLRGK